MKRRREQERYVEIDRRWFYGILLAAAVIALVCAISLGRAFTPDPPRLVSWRDWEARKVEQQYERELVRLREDLAELRDMLLAENPDPVQAELTAVRLEQRHSQGLGLLEQQREAVVTAARVVRDWAAGYAAYGEAVTIVNEAIEIVGIVGEEKPDGQRTVGHELREPEPTATPWWTDNS